MANSSSFNFDLKVVNTAGELKNEESIPKQNENYSPKRKYDHKFWFCGLSVSVPIFAGSLLIGYVMCLTEIFNDEILKHVVIRDGNQVFNIWTNSQIPNIINFYAFNYTNYQKVLEGEEKPNVSEVGPYVFREMVERVNVIDHKNGTITYQEHRSHEFIEEVSKGSIDDEIYVPNIPYITSIKRDSRSASLSLVKAFALQGLRVGFSPDPFMKLTVGEFAWGFRDTYSDFTRSLASLLKQPVPKKYGILAMRSGLNPDKITIGTGDPDLSKLGIIQQYNDKSRIGVWESDECDSFEASEGTLFPGKYLSPSSVLYLYVKDFCRRLPLYYKERVTALGYAAYRFTYPKNIFASSKFNSDNACFCNSSCLPSGAFDIQHCMFGAPMAVSFPHFLYGEKALQEGVHGLKPDPEKHSSYMDLHKRIALPLIGQNRFQINMYIPDALLKTYKGIPERTVLPLAWLGFEIGKLSQQASDLVYEISIKSTILELFLMWGSLLSFLLSGGFIILSVFKLCALRKKTLLDEE